jgi:hypothetical protein
MPNSELFNLIARITIDPKMAEAANTHDLSNPEYKARFAAVCQETFGHGQGQIVPAFETNEGEQNGNP